MQNMREIKHRIKSIRQTKQITRAMKLISASKLKRARQQLEQTTPYFNKITETMKEILLHSKGIDNIFFGSGKKSEDEKKVGFIVITGDKGLAGSYNHNIIKIAEEQLKDNPNAGLFVIGYMGKGYFMRKKYNIDLEFDFFLQNPNIYRARDIASVMIDLYSNGHLDEIYVIYTKAISTIKVEPEILKLLPLDYESFVKPGEEVKLDEELIYEPSPDKVLDVLVPKYLKGVIYGTLVESFTSEQCARMIAMDNATKNADEMLGRLNLAYNRARQAAITQEISEVIGGASALT